MPQLLLTLDRGNSTLDCQLHLAAPRRARLASARGITALLGELRPDHCIGVTVVPDGLQEAEALLAARGLRLHQVLRDLPCPLTLDYETPATLGPDRWLGALAAWRHCRGAALTVDCGSATTLNWITADGVFRGGPIAPGHAALVAGMRALTPNLPTPRDAEPTFPPRSSQAAVDAGIAVGFCGMVDRLLDEMLAVAGTATPVLLTGGAAPHYQRGGRHRVVAVADLVHRGLALLAERLPCSG